MRNIWAMFPLRITIIIWLIISSTSHCLGLGLENVGLCCMIYSILGTKRFSRGLFVSCIFKVSRVIYDYLLKLDCHSMIFSFTLRSNTCHSCLILSFIECLKPLSCSISALTYAHTKKYTTMRCCIFFGNGICIYRYNSSILHWWPHNIDCSCFWSKICCGFCL